MNTVSAHDETCIKFYLPLLRFSFWRCIVRSIKHFVLFEFKDVVIDTDFDFVITQELSVDTADVFLYFLKFGLNRCVMCRVGDFNRGTMLPCLFLRFIVWQ